MPGYRHGVYISEQETSIFPPRRVSAGIPFVVGTAPIEGKTNKYINELRLVYSYAEFVDFYGWDDDFEKYTLCEFAKCFFSLYSVAPMICVNVYDPAVHESAGTPDPLLVTSADIIGGIDPDTGKKLGLELLNQAFSKYQLVPGIVCAPKFSMDSAVAIVMESKAKSINGLFKAVAVVDGPETSGAYTFIYSDMPNYKTVNNITGEQHIFCWPKCTLGAEEYHLSTQVAALLARVDTENEDVPYVSPSNKRLSIDGVKGENNFLSHDEANYLNGNGIVTAFNFVKGWVAWGSRTGAYPGVTDVKDAFIPVRRMFNWLGNELVLSLWQKVDGPIRKRLIDSVVDSYNIRLNGLAAREFILGGRVVFLKEENPYTDIIDGIIKFHIYVTPPVPAREIDFILEFDPTYFETLFA